MTGIIILAAGSSSRMGRAKQNLLFKGETLLQIAVGTALSAESELVAVVLGANASIIQSTICHKAINVFVNQNWEHGMGSSISFGLSELLKLQPKITSVLFMLADQPFTDVQFVNKLIASLKSGKIVASTYNDALGPPVLFDKAFFAELLEMQGNDGAKKTLQKHPEKVIEVPFALGAFDIDTPEDYERLSAL